MTFQIRQEDVRGICVLSTHGYIDKVAGQKLLQQVDGLVKNGRMLFLIDFSETPIVNSSGLGEIVETVSMTLGNDRLSFAFCGLSQTCDFSFRAVGIQYYAKIFTTREEAVKGLGPTGT